MASKRVYCNGALSKKTLAAELDEGFVLTDVVRRGYHGGDVAYFRRGTEDEILDCRRRMAHALMDSTPAVPSDAPRENT